MSGNETIKVTVDEDLKDLIPGFIANREKDIEMLTEHVEKYDYDSIRTIGHGMKGAGSGYGFSGITEIGSEMEKSALAKDIEGVQMQLHLLKKYLRSIEIVYEC